MFRDVGVQHGEIAALLVGVLALARQDGQSLADTVTRAGLVQVMRNLLASPDDGWLGTQLEITQATTVLPESPSDPENLQLRA